MSQDIPHIGTELNVVTDLEFALAFFLLGNIFCSCESLLV
jgi:hypothetical protein